MKNNTERTKSDITATEDFSIGVMNLISLEEHLVFSFFKSGKKEFLHIYDTVRKMRIKLMKKLLKNFDAEVWCCSKHLLSATMRFIETGTKFLSDEKEEDSIEFYKSAFDLYSLFWFLQKIGDNNAGRIKHKS